MDSRVDRLGRAEVGIVDPGEMVEGGGAVDDGNNSTSAAPELDTSGMNATDDGEGKPYPAVCVTAADTVPLGRGTWH